MEVDELAGLDSWLCKVSIVLKKSLLVIFALFLAQNIACARS